MNGYAPQVLKELANVVPNIELVVKLCVCVVLSIHGGAQKNKIEQGSQTNQVKGVRNTRLCALVKRRSKTPEKERGTERREERGERGERG